MGWVIGRFFAIRLLVVPTAFMDVPKRQRGRRYGQAYRMERGRKSSTFDRRTKGWE